MTIAIQPPRSNDPAVFGRDAEPIAGAVTAWALSQLSAEELQQALEGLADFAADFLAREFVEALDDARG